MQQKRSASFPELKNVIMRRSGSLLYYMQGSKWDSIAVPVRLQSHVVDSINTDRLPKLVSVLCQTKQIVTQLSPLLFDMFGTSDAMIRNSTHNLLCDLALDEASDVTLEEAAFDIYTTLQEQHAEHSLSRRRELVPRLFSDATTLSVELMGWYKFVTESGATLIDHRYNVEEKSPEYLYEYKARRFLVARCRTGKVVVLPIGAAVDTCENAQSWLWGDTVVGMSLPKIHCIGRH